MVVRALDALPLAPRQDLDDLIDAAIRTARERGFTLQELRKRVRERLLIEPPDHVLIVEPEPGMRRLLQLELAETLPFTVEAMLPDELPENRGAAIGALVLTLPGRAQHVLSLLPKGHPFLVLEPSGIDAHVKLVHELRRASVIGVASISRLLLEMAGPLLAPFVGSFHSLEEHHLEDSETRDLSGLDLVFCDTVARRRVKARRVAEYRLVSSVAVREISDRVGAVD